MSNKLLNEIEHNLEITDFKPWIDNNNLPKNYPHFVLFGINPIYYFEIITEKERNDLSSGLLFFMLPKIKDIEILFEWKGDWNIFIRQLYDNGFTTTPFWKEECKNFIQYANEQKLIPDHFDHYIKYQNYRPDYPSLLKRKPNVPLIGKIVVDK